jgi:integrase
LFIMPRVNLTKRVVDGLQPGDQVFDEFIRGFGARALPSGRVSFFVKYVERKSGKQRLLTLGQHGNITIEKARKLAEIARGRVADGRDPAAEHKIERRARKQSKTVSEVLDDFMERYVKGRGLRSEGEYSRVYEVDVKPAIGSISLVDLSRSDIVRMLDKIESRGAPVMADRVLAHLRSALNWHAARDDHFVPPIVKGMSRTRPRQRSRTRILSDDEIRALWKCTASVEPQVFGVLLRFLLLTAARRDEAANGAWDELDKNGTWIIPEARYKTGMEHELPLSKSALEVLNELSRTGTRMFTTRRDRPFSGFSKPKRVLDAAMLKDLRRHDPKAKLERWTIHDLRRTARSLLSRAGVQADIAERVLGHTIPGVRGIYDRHRYFEEKKAALNNLAQAIDRILIEP